jgi:hypothetical protein
MTPETTHDAGAPTSDLATAAANAGPVADTSRASVSPSPPPSGEGAGPDVGSAVSRRAGLYLPSGWYLLGLAVQVFLWFLVFLGLAIAIGVGGHLTEFRYVGF